MGDYEYVNISSSAVLGIKLWRLEQKLSFIFIQIHLVESSRLIQSVIINVFFFASRQGDVRTCLRRLRSSTAPPLSNGSDLKLK